MTQTYFIDDETVRTVEAWRRAKSSARPGASVWSIMRAYARQHGIAIAMRCDDCAVLFELVAGKLRQRTIAADRILWTWEGREG